MLDIRILGCSGGLGVGEYTTSLQINKHILIDAGTGLGTLAQEDLKLVRQIFLTHAHLDHICCLPLMIDNLYGVHEEPLQIFASSEVILHLQTHIFNWQIWPDFSELPSPEAPSIVFIPFNPGDSISTDGLIISAFEVSHVVTTQGYSVDSVGGKFVFAGDTGISKILSDELNKLGKIDILLLECAFPDEMLDLAGRAQHLTPVLVAELLETLREKPGKLLITHLKPAKAAEIREALVNFDINAHFATSGEVHKVG